MDLYKYEQRVITSITRDELKLLLTTHIKRIVRPEVVTMVEAADHLSHFSDLQTIEIVWALIKTNVAVQYKTGTMLKDVRQRLDEQVSKLAGAEGYEQVEQIIRRVDALIDDISKKIVEDDVAGGNAVSCAI